MSAVYKTKLSKEQFKQHPEKLNELRLLFEQMGGRGDKPLSKVSIANYIHKLNKLATLVLKHGFDGDFQWLIKDADKVINMLSESNISSKKDYCSPVVKILKQLKTDPMIIEKYSKCMSSFKDTETNIRKQNKGSEKDNDNFIDYQEVLQKINDFKPKDDEDLVYKMILSLYFQNSFVPRNNLITMKFVSDKKKPKDMSDDFNYIVVDKNRTPVEIIMNHYKSRSTYGKVKFPLLERPKQLMKEYISRFNKQNGDYLIVTKDDQPFKQSNFIDFLGNITQKILGKRLNINLIRKIQISDYYKKPHSIDQDEKDALRYLHSADMHKQYMMIDKIVDDNEE